jgi:hypothetical protein
VKVPIATPGENPVPLTETVLPTGASVGLRAMPGMKKMAWNNTLLVFGSLITTRPLLDPLVVIVVPAGMLPELSVVNW